MPYRRALALMFLLAPIPVIAGNITAQWTGFSTQLWSDPGSWVQPLPLPGYPTNSGPFLYDVSVPQFTPPVSVDVSPTIDTLTLDPGANVAVNPARTLTLSGTSFGPPILTNQGGGIYVAEFGVLNLSGSGYVPISNDGNIRIQPYGQLSLSGSGAHVDLSGGGMLTLDGPGALVSGTGTQFLRNELPHTIQGAGTLQGFAFENDGTIDANAGGGLAFAPAVAVVEH